MGIERITRYLCRTELDNQSYSIWKPLCLGTSWMYTWVGSRRSFNLEIQVCVEARKGVGGRS